MDHIFQTGLNQKHVLYTIDNHIIIRRIQSDTMSRPSYLTHDFMSSLSSTIYNDIIYYAYITTEGVLSLRHIYSSVQLFGLTGDDSCRYEQAFITTFNSHLLLFYCINNLSASTWDIKYILSPESAPSPESASENVLTGLIYPPTLSVLNTETHLILSIRGTEEKHILELSPELSLISHDEINDNMERQSHRQLERISELQSDVDNLQKASNLMMSKISSLLEENEKLRKEYSGLKEDDNSYAQELAEKEEKIRSLSASLNETKKALTIREAQIESAKKQYNELMDVAERYRDEAIKWRMKLAAK